MPKLWNETIAAHRDSVREATLNATAALVAEHGLTSVTMSQIAKESGIGRATLYKYFPDIDAILAAWHERQVGEHLHRLSEVGDRAKGGARDRLQAVLRTYADLSRRDHDDNGELASLLHQSDHIAKAHAHLHAFVTELVSAAVASGDVRDDVPAGELASYCLFAVTAASAVSSKAAVDRLVTVTLDGLRPHG
jgi:AcrR family transcriptional regulator